MKADDLDREPTSPADAERKAEPVVPLPRLISSAALLAGQAQLAIRHRETMYFLRETRFGKLILTK
ncbi:MAG TPA: hemin uptake protein HemP [Casimicrobiaceae bacterium]|nr:hemin uptake protein HemP [Casimicrobiaceae bacterium]